MREYAGVIDLTYSPNDTSRDLAKIKKRRRQPTRLKQQIKLEPR